MNFQIKNFIPEQREALNQLALDAFSDFKEIYEDWLGFSQKISNMASLSKNSEIIVAVQDQQLLGAVAYLSPKSIKSEMFDKDWAVLRMLVVDPKKRGLRIGKALTLECINRAIQNGASHIGLHTSPIMTIALPMYLRLGFTKYKDVPDIHGASYGVYVKSMTKQDR